ncbi:MAG: ATP-dependent Clp protease adaptor ClpS [Phycisphaeraceae bacterium]
MARPKTNASEHSTERGHQQPKAPPPKPQQLPPYRVLLHNDDRNSMDYVTRTVFQLTPLNWPDARGRMQEAHASGTALLVLTHKERAELYQQQFVSKGLTVTIEPEAT